MRKLVSPHQFYGNVDVLTDASLASKIYRERMEPLGYHAALNSCWTFAYHVADAIVNRELIYVGDVAGMWDFFANVRANPAQQGNNNNAVHQV